MGNIKVIVNNRKAFFDYEVLDTIEAGIALVGSEIKSVKAGNCNLKDSFISITQNNEVILKNMFIKRFEYDSLDVSDEKKERKLLLKKSEILKLLAKVKEKGITLVPLKLYFNGKYVKVEVGLVRGKHTYDKKESLKEKDIKRETEREVKRYNSNY